MTWKVYFYFYQALRDSKVWKQKLRKVWFGNINKTEERFQSVQEDRPPISWLFTSSDFQLWKHLHVISIKTRSCNKSRVSLWEQIDRVLNSFWIAEENMFYLTKRPVERWEYLLYTYVFISFLKQALSLHSQKESFSEGMQAIKIFSNSKSQRNTSFGFIYLCVSF